MNQQHRDFEQSQQGRNAFEPRVSEDGPLQPPAACPGGVDVASTAVLRVIDAAANRAREALRVIEDYARYVLDDRHLTALCKQLRHKLVAALEPIPTAQRIAARETQHDVGTTLTTSGEQTRHRLGDVAAAAFGRLQEALRSLEEFAKIVNPEVGAAIKSLRYESYTIQRAIEVTGRRSLLLQDAQLYVLIDSRSDVEQFARLVQALVAAGVHAIQLRDKQTDDRELLGRARLLRELTIGSQTLCVVNDRPDIAALSRADGVHVGQTDMSVKDCRAMVGPDALIGVSTHSLPQARQAVLDGADYIGVGPVFPSATKSFDHFPGLELVQAVAAEVRLPAFAIGGVTLDNLAQVLSAGCRRVAVSGAILSASEPAEMAKAFLAALREQVS